MIDVVPRVAVGIADGRHAPNREVGYLAVGRRQGEPGQRAARVGDDGRAGWEWRAGQSSRHTPSRVPVSVSGGDAALLAPQPQHGPAVVVRPGHPIQFSSSRDSSAMLLAQDMCPHDVLCGRLAPLFGARRDLGESDHPRGLGAGLAS